MVGRRGGGGCYRRVGQFGDRDMVLGQETGKTGGINAFVTSWEQRGRRRIGVGGDAIWAD